MGIFTRACIDWGLNPDGSKTNPYVIIDTEWSAEKEFNGKFITQEKLDEVVEEIRRKIDDNIVNDILHINSVSKL